jgi:hypothetical protein
LNEVPSKSRKPCVLPDERFYRGSEFGRRFHYDLTAIINRSVEGDKIACANIISYYIESLHLKNPIRPEVIQYLFKSINSLSPSEKSRTFEVLKVNDHLAIDKALHEIPQLSKAGLNRFIEKISAIRGQPGLTDKVDLNRIRIGAQVAKLHRKYSDRYSMDYEHTKRMGYEPLERAIKEVDEKRKLGRSAVKKHFRLFKQFAEWGCVDEDGNFIINN